jgi:hypothetical protein
MILFLKLINESFSKIPNFALASIENELVDSDGTTIEHLIYTRFFLSNKNCDVKWLILNY